MTPFLDRFHHIFFTSFVEQFIEQPKIQQSKEYMFLNNSRMSLDQNVLAVFNFTVTEAFAMGTYMQSVEGIMQRVCDHFEFMEKMYEGYTVRWMPTICNDITVALATMTPVLLHPWQTISNSCSRISILTSFYLITRSVEQCHILDNLYI